MGKNQESEDLDDFGGIFDEKTEEDLETEEFEEDAEEEDDDFDFNAFVPVTSASTTNQHGHGGGGKTKSLAIVNTDGNGKRISLSKSFFASLGFPKSVQVSCNQAKGELLIGHEIPGVDLSFKFSSGKGFTIIYNSPLVKILTDTFGIDFSERSSRSFNDVRIIEKVVDGKKLVLGIVKIC